MIHHTLPCFVKSSGCLFLVVPMSKFVKTTTRLLSGTEKCVNNSCVGNVEITRLFRKEDRVRFGMLCLPTILVSDGIGFSLFSLA
jgi:hypothetical protein